MTCVNTVYGMPSVFCVSSGAEGMLFGHWFPPHAVKAVVQVLTSFVLLINAMS